MVEVLAIVSQIQVFKHEVLSGVHAILLVGLKSGHISLLDIDRADLCQSK